MPIFYKMPADILARTDLHLTAKVVYCVIVDRMGRNGKCWPGVRRLAKDCAISAEGARRAIAQLAEKKLINIDAAEDRKRGQSNHYSLPESDNSVVASDGIESDNSVGEAPTQLTPAPTQLPLSANSVDVTRVDQLNQTKEPDPPTPQGVAHPAPPEANPDLFGEVSSEPPAKPKPRAKPSTNGHRWPAETVAAIYEAYPRHIGRAKALTAIEKALTFVASRNGLPDPAAWMLGRAQAFAASDAGHRGVFTPHPTTWFNQGRYDDDDTEWNRTADSVQPGQRLGRIEAPPGKYDRFRSGGNRAAGSAGPAGTQANSAGASAGS